VPTLLGGEEEGVGRRALPPLLDGEHEGVRDVGRYRRRRRRLRTKVRELRLPTGLAANMRE